MFAGRPQISYLSVGGTDGRSVAAGHSNGHRPSGRLVSCHLANSSETPRRQQKLHGNFSPLLYIINSNEAPKMIAYESSHETLFLVS